MVLKVASSGVTQPGPIVPLGKWMPDQPDLPTSQGFRFGLNLIPRDDGSYGPEKELETFQSSAITAVGSALKFHGSLHSAPASTGQVPRYFAGTFATGAGSSKLLSREEAGGWVDKSVVGGYNCSGFTPWRFANFGTKVLAINRNTNLQISDGGGGLFRNITGAPRGIDVATVRGFAVVINFVDSTHGFGDRPYQAYWSGAGDAESWLDPQSDAGIASGTNVSDLLHGGGPLQRIIPGIGGSDAIIVASRKMWRMRFVGSPKIFDFDEIECDQGTNMPGSIAVLNETFFFFGHNHFYFFDGSNAQRIGAGSVDKFFSDDSTFSSIFGLQMAVEAGIDSENGCYVISYRNSAAPGDANNRILRYNWTTDTWSNSAQAVDCMYQADSQASTTDSPRIVYVGNDFQLKRPSISSNLEAIIETGEAFQDGFPTVEIQGVMPITDANDIRVSMKTRDRLNQARQQSAEQIMQDDGCISFQPQNPTGRFYLCRKRIPSTATWTAISGSSYKWQEHSYGPRFET